MTTRHPFACLAQLQYLPRVTTPESWVGLCRFNSAGVQHFIFPKWADLVDLYESNGDRFPAKVEKLHRHAPSIVAMPMTARAAGRRDDGRVVFNDAVATQVHNN